jgi:hypothetical protein
MKHFLFTPLLLALLAGPAHAQEAPEEAEGLPAPTLSAAIDNLELENDRLHALLDKEALSEEDHDIIYQLSYTLENALAKIEEEVSATLSRVEELRMGAENREDQPVHEHGRAYLEIMETLLRQHVAPEPHVGNDE